MVRAEIMRLLHLKVDSEPIRKTKRDFMSTLPHKYIIKPKKCEFEGKCLHHSVIKLPGVIEDTDSLAASKEYGTKTRQKIKTI